MKRIGNTNCCVKTCKNYYKNTNSDVKFYSFPTASHGIEQCNQWISWVKKVNPIGWEPTKYSQICSEHFIKNKLSTISSSPSYVPSIINQNVSSVQAKERSIERFQRSSCERMIVEGQTDCSKQSDQAKDQAVQACIYTKHYKGPFQDDSKVFLCHQFTHNNINHVQMQVYVPEETGKCVSTNITCNNKAIGPNTPPVAMRNILQCPTGFHEFCSIIGNQGCLDLCGNLELTEKPSMCLKCWECLQIAYTFKKNYEETEKKIKLYNQKFKSRNQSIVEKMLPLIKQYFRDNENNTAGDSEEESADSNNYNADRIRCEHSYIKSPVEIEPILFSKNKQQKRPLQKQKRQFSEEEDQALLTSYFEVTSNEQNFSTGYLRRIHNKWQRMCSKRSVKVSTLRGRLSTLLRNNSIPVQATKKVVEKPNVEYKEQCISENCVKTDSQETEPNESSISYNNMHYNSSDNFREINLNHTLSNSATENDRIKIEELSDSDDTFTEEAVKSSFTPHVKTDPLDDSDSEIDVVETRIERFSKDTWENLPQLERMDIPPMTFRIEATYSLDDKRDAFNSVKNDSYLDPNLEVEEVKTCRKFLFKNQSEEGLFKCLSCNFETKFRGRANCHSRWHKKGKNGRKLYKCNICPYKISNKRMIKIHEKLHKEENDIPVLVPMCT